MWANARDRAEDQSLSARYVSRDTVGYQQLDAYGEWRTDTEFGTVWIPRVNSGQWAPFRNGQWRWIAPWGWTWVDDAPWGFAPFHYGRWAQIGAQWCWVPGPVAPRPAYMPAVVGFQDPFAGQDRRHPPSNNWYPLAPGQAWRPASRPPVQQPGFPSGVGVAPAWQGGPTPLQPIPHPRPEVRMVDPMVQPLNGMQDLQQRAQWQRQQQADRERQQQEQNRLQLQGQQREQMQRDAAQQQMREQQNRIQQQQAEQAQREQLQREQNQRTLQQQHLQQPAQQPQPMPRPQVREAAPNPSPTIWTPDRKRLLRPGEDPNR